MWLPCASLPLFCSMSNVKTFLYPDLLPLFWGGTWTGTGWALSWICSRVAQLSLELGRSLDGVTQKWCLPLPLCWQCQLHFLPVPQGSWDLCAAARKTWHAHEIESLCWAIDAGPFLQVPCCPTFTGSASSLAYGWSYLDAAKESIRAAEWCETRRVFATGVWLSCRHWLTDGPGEVRPLCVSCSAIWEQMRLDSRHRESPERIRK